MNLQNRVFGIFGSYSWSGGAVKRLKEFSESCKYDLTQPVVEVKFAPRPADLERCRELGRNIAAKV
jgi:flavorubredoxin